MWPQYRGHLHPCVGQILPRHLLHLRGVRGSHHRQVLHSGGRQVGGGDGGDGCGCGGDGDGGDGGDGDGDGGCDGGDGVGDSK